MSFHKVEMEYNQYFSLHGAFPDPFHLKKSIQLMNSCITLDNISIGTYKISTWQNSSG